MIDIFLDDIHIKSIKTIAEGFRLDFEQKEKSESLHLVLNKEDFIDLYIDIKNRCETMQLIPIKKE